MDIIRVLDTMTPRSLVRIMSDMYTVVIMATVAVGAFRLIWRAFSPPEPEAEEWTADE